MKQVRLGANPKKYMAVRCQRARLLLRLLLFERNRLYSHGAQACHQKCRAEPFAVHLAVYLFGRLFDAKLFEQLRQLFVADTAARHFKLNQFLGRLLPGFIRLSTLIGQSVHHIPTDIQLKSLVPSQRLWTPILGRIRLDINGQHYTSSESHFCEDSLLRIHPTDRVGTPLLVTVPGDAP
jgi:hypothetical protein